eukprot:4393684-Prymnesium_polylepis.1
MPDAQPVSNRIATPPDRRPSPHPCLVLPGRSARRSQGGHVDRDVPGHHLPNDVWVENILQEQDPYMYPLPLHVFAKSQLTDRPNTQLCARNGLRCRPFRRLQRQRQRAPTGFAREHGEAEPAAVRRCRDPTKFSSSFGDMSYYYYAFDSLVDEARRQGAIGRA